MVKRTTQCLDCGELTPGNFCSHCGQRNADLRVSLWELCTEALDGLLQLDMRVFRTLPAFLFRPARLTREYSAGRRTRYTSPLRLYLFFSFAYFFLLSVHPPATALQVVDASSTGKLELTPTGSIHTGFPQLDQRINQRITELAHLDRKDALRRVGQGVLEQAPKLMFVLLPFFALLLKLLYWRSRRYYVEHLTLALYFHAFVFFCLLLQQLLPLWATLPLLGVISLYLLLSLLGIYHQSVFRTCLKMSILCFCYALLLIAGGGLTLAVAVLLS